MAVTGADAGVVEPVSALVIADHAVSVRDDAMGLSRRAGRAISSARMAVVVDV